MGHELKLASRMKRNESFAQRTNAISHYWKW